MDLIVKSCSATKPRVPARMTEHVNPNITKSDFKKNVRERAQPMKIYELLGESPVKTTQKTSEKKKKMLPERLAGFCTEVKDTRQNKEKKGTETPCPKKARRNLNFNNISVHISKKQTLQEETTVTSKTKLKQTDRRISSIPLFLKDNPKEKTNPAGRRYSKLPLPSKVSQLPGKSPRVPKSSTKEALSATKKGMKKVQYNNTPGRKVKVAQTLQEETQEKESVEEPRSTHKFVIETINTKQPTRMTRTSSIMDLELANKGLPVVDETPIRKLKDSRGSYNCALNTCVDHGSDTIRLKTKDFLDLRENLQTVIKRTEEDLCKMKFILSNVTDMLNSSGNCEESNTESVTPKQRKRISSVKKLPVEKHDKEIQVATCCVVDENLSTPVARKSVIRLTANEKYEDKENIEEAEEYDSFIQMESRMLEKEDTKVSAPNSAQKRHTRSLREYIALKSSISFLETPNTKRCRSLSDNNVNKLSVEQRQISNKLLADLQNLYSESPSSNVT